VGFGGAVEDIVKLYTVSALYGEYQCWGDKGFCGYNVAVGGVCYILLVLFRYHCPTLSSTML
jgi:hypothetical protein